jgi:hypothetical protein
MKKEFLFVLGLAGTLMAHADDYPYLTFLDTNGTEQSVAATGLVITFSDGQMNATDNNGKVTTISLSDLKKMYFSSTTSAIDSTETEEETKDSEVEVFTLAGNSLGKYEDIRQAKTALQKGVYVVKRSHQTLKIAVQ